MVWHGIGIGWSTARCGITTCKSPPLHSTLCDLVSSWFGMVLFGLIYYNIIWLGIVCYGIISCHMWGHYLQVGTHLPLTVSPPTLPPCHLASYPASTLPSSGPTFFFFAIFLCELSLCDWTNGSCLSHIFCIRNKSHLPSYSYQSPRHPCFIETLQIFSISISFKFFGHLQDS